MFKYVHHVVYAVKNRDAIVEFIEKTFDMKPDRLRDDQVYAREAYYDIDKTTIQVTQPLDLNSSIGKFLATQGPGVYHVAWAVDDIEKAVQTLKDKGTKMREEKGAQAGPRGYNTINIDRASAMGLWFQLADGKSRVGEKVK